MRIAESDRAVVAAEATALATGLPEGDSQRSYRALAVAAWAGEVPDELDGALGSLLALSLETGRVRSVHGPEGVRALTAIWRESPDGRRAVEDAEQLTRALGALAGSVLRTVRVTASAPGSHTVSIEAGDAAIRVVFERGGARLAGVDVGVGGVGE